MWGISLTHPVLPSFLSGEFLLQIPCWLVLFLLFLLIIILGVSLTHPVLVYYFLGGNFSYTSHGGFIFLGGVSLTHPVLASLIWGVSLTHPVLPSFLSGGFLLFLFFFKSGEFLLHIPCWFIFYWGSFSYISRFLVVCFSFFCFVFVFAFVSLSLSGEFLLHIPCWLHFYLGSFSYTSHVGFTFLRGVSLAHPVLAF